MRKRNEVVVITGASAGVGRATAQAFARVGASIGLVARGQEGLEGAKREVEALGGRALACVADVSDDKQVEAAAEAVERELGPIDVWVNNAMASVFSPVDDITPEEFRRVTDVTYLGYVWGTMAALRRMKPRNRGMIVQVGSALAYRGIPLQAAYCGAKHAVQGFNDSLRCELLHERSKIGLCMVQMPALNTPQFGWVKSRLPNKAQPVPPVYQPEIAAEAILYASRHRRREVYVGGATVKAILANRLAPGLADRYLARTGFKSQQVEGEPEDPCRPDNLFSPIPGDRGAHGRFDNQSRQWSPELWMIEHRRSLLGAAVAAGAAILAIGARAGRNNGNGARR